ncbi:MAG: NAD-dependent epimerase/dehydratase family protein [Candidatus Portnoybacteria bacterium]|nr:NAD-dependent epimerase/dehydratase family protein [Candidatus Portnoybacteria bacterium]
MEEDFWKNKKVLVTGGAGFAGSHLVEKLVSLGALVTVPIRTSESDTTFLHRVRKKINVITADLQDAKKCLNLTKGTDIVMHLAKVAKGLSYNKGRQGYIFNKNMIPFINVLEGARINGVEKFLTVSSACIYPRNCTIPTPEEEGFKDIPEISNIGYGWAKRMYEFLSQTYAEEYGMKIAIARPYNAYGPRDDFGDDAHAIPSIIKRVINNEDPLIIWGDGSQSRSFLYVDDLVDGLLLITEKYPLADPINLGNNEETTIKELTELIVKLAGKKPKVIFDAAKPTGQRRRKCDTAKLENILGFKAKVKLEDGLRKTIEWYKNFYHVHELRS